MTSFSIAEGGWACNCSKPAESFVYYKRNTPSHKFTVPQSTTSQRRCEHSKFTWQVLVTQEWLSALPDARNFVLQCLPHLTVEEGCIAFQLNSWAPPLVMHSPYPTDKPITRVFCSCFYSHFTHTLATTWPDVLVHTRDCAFTTVRIRSPPPSAIKNDIILRSC